MMLDKEKRAGVNVGERLTSAITSLFDYYKKEGEDKLEKLFKKKENLMFAVDVVQGLISLTKGDMSGIKPLAIKLGGFPEDLEKLDQLVAVFKMGKDGINFKAVGTLAADNIGTMVSLIGLSVPGGDKTTDFIG